MARRKGQAALEFLTTYGWAILMVTILIGALSYFGVLDPEALLPERCTFSPDFICEDYQMIGSPDYEVNMKLRHNIGETIVLENVTCTYPRGGDGTVDFGSQAWAPKETVEVTCTPDGSGAEFLVRGNKEKVAIDITYKNDPTGYDHHAGGEVYANVI